MKEDLWIEIPRWREFQHYKDRDPKWIKNYQRLLHNADYRRLSGHQRGVLHGLWMLYASCGRQLPLDTASITAQLGLRVSSLQLESLNHAGFILILSSTALAQSREEESRKTLASTREKEPVGVLDQLDRLRKAHQREEANGISQAVVI